MTREEYRKIEVEVENDIIATINTVFVISSMIIFVVGLLFSLIIGLPNFLTYYPVKSLIWMFTSTMGFAMIAYFYNVRKSEKERRKKK